MDALLARFYLSVRKKDGTEYEPDTITSIHNSIDRHFKDLKMPYSIKAEEFSHSKRVLETKRKSLKGMGKGNKKMKADPLDKEEVQLLYEYNCLGAGNPKSLLNSVWLNNGVYFGMRGRQDHTNLLWGDIELKMTSDAKEYLEFTEKSTKTRNGAKVGDFRKVSPKIFAVPDDENCPIKIYKAYRSHRPLDMNCENARFYLCPLDNPKSDIWYSRQVLGKNTLGSMMNNMATQAGLKGRKVNHSSRQTFATTLVQDGKPPTEIAQLGGWKNIQTINEYAMPSMKQQQEASHSISNVLLPNSKSVGINDLHTGCSPDYITHFQSNACEKLCDDAISDNMKSGITNSSGEVMISLT